MNLSSLKAAIFDYERITGETVQNYDYTEYINGVFFNPKNNKYMLVLPSNEWMIYAIGEREGLSYLWLDQMYGWMQNFAPHLKEIMRICNLEIVITATQRNPKIYARKWKMEWLKERDYCFEGRFYHVLKGHISNLTRR